MTTDPFRDALPLTLLGRTAAVNIEQTTLAMRRRRMGWRTKAAYYLAGVASGWLSFLLMLAWWPR